MAVLNSISATLNFRRVCETCSSMVITVRNTLMIAINYLLHRLKLLKDLMTDMNDAIQFILFVFILIKFLSFENK